MVIKYSSDSIEALLRKVGNRSANYQYKFPGVLVHGYGY
jgi:hypothetical protein